MKRERDQTAYGFDPTAIRAIDRVTRQEEQRSTGTESPGGVNPGNLYHASAEDLAKLKGAIFEPDRLITNKQLGRSRGYLYARSRN